MHLSPFQVQIKGDLAAFIPVAEGCHWSSLDYWLQADPFNRNNANRKIIINKKLGLTIHGTLSITSLTKSVRNRSFHVLSVPHMLDSSLVSVISIRSLPETKKVAAQTITSSFSIKQV